ncbi:GNAT family N-acetyltransferase [Paludicola sp. MB14-C6]|uniref:GNAT family N-acetyltransferase n=1 Tax=Paludihabitans sp. MB14-C6 TaxID=3070656 RepID=UPI0027DBD606|nr:GNAT family N-acetyltransferase [Paludicola sp. MB14-C6]WMJ24330.1 GNAT family N-acetyltransferase [Paludicola sp. MB14-C6]
MVLETERLELVPLSLERLKLLKDNLNMLEKELDCVYKGEALEGFILEYLDKQIRVISNNSESCLYNAFWLLIRKSDRIAVGSAAFKGLPNGNGEIEIGYGLGNEFEHNGYMTEGVCGMCKWGLAQKEVKHIIAETDIHGYASQRILERNGFERYRFNDSIWWRL